MDASHRTPPAATFQELVLRLMTFWAERGCLLTQPFDAEKGAGTYNPSTFLRAIGPEPWRTAYVEPSRRPTDGRYGENPNRLYRHHQFQVLLKPSPPDLQGLYLESLRAIGIHPEEHDIRFVEDNWESPTLGAWGLGWEVWVDGMEATQFTYFQQCGGLECRPVAGELTYGMERLAMYLQDIDNVYDLAYAPGVTYGQVFHQDEVEYSKLTFEALDTGLYGELYDKMEKETQRLVEAGLPVPAYDHLLHAAHAFNALDAKGAISVTERQGYILRIRDLARMTAEGYLASRESLGFPLGRADEPPAAPDLPTAVDGSGEDGTLFVELGTEELPAGEVVSTVESLSKLLVERLDALELPHGEPESFATPRRVAVRIPGVAGRQPDRVIEASGPPVKAAFKDGKPTKAAEGFARSQGLTVDQLEKRDTPKGEYLFAVVERKGQLASALLPEVVQGALSGLSFKRSMRWGSGNEAFSRPVVWLVAMHAGQVIPVQFAGVVSDNLSRGHRFLAPETFVVDPETYEAELEARKVVVSVAKRRALVLEGAEARAKAAGGALMDLPDLVDEITQLVEWPVALLGGFEETYLEIPKEVLVSEMVEHQRYLPILGADGALLPKFVVVANTEVEDPAKSVVGYRRVLSARFSDGKFFFVEDQKTPLGDRVEALGKVRFHRALGSLLEKVERLSALSFGWAIALGEQLGASVDLAGKTPFAWAAEAEPSGDARFSWALARAAFLAKADLTSQMVFEFPELQGIIGAEYAKRGGEPADVASAIAEHYMPRGADDALPEGILGALVGLGDRLDTLVGIFATGKGPSGAADPFALRRATLSIIRILRARGWHVSIEQMVKESLRTLGDKPTKPLPEIEAEVAAFFRARLKAALTAEGVPADVAEAALTAGSDDVVDAAERAHALAKLRGTAEMEAIKAPFKRATNLAKDKTLDAVDPATLGESVERDLYEACVDVGRRARLAASARDFDAAFGTLADIRPALDAFFEGVMVMDEDEAVRARRLGLLGMALDIFSPLADLTKLS